MKVDHLPLTISVLSLFLLLSCESQPTFTTSVENPSFGSEQKEMVNRVLPNELIPLNYCDFFAQIRKTATLQNGKVIEQEVDSEGTWKDKSSYTFTDGVVNAMTDGVKKYENVYDGDKLIESMSMLYTNENGRVSKREHKVNKESHSYSYPNDACVETYHQSSKSDFKMRLVECKDDKGQLRRNEEHVDRDGGRLTSTINEYVYEDGNVTQHIYQETKMNEPTRDVEKIYTYENGLLTRMTSDSKVLGIKSVENYMYEIHQNNPVKITKYMQRNEAPREKLMTWTFDNGGFLTEMIYHRDHEYSRRYRVE